MPKLYFLVLIYNKRLTSSKQPDYFTSSKDSDSHFPQSCPFSQQKNDFAEKSSEINNFPPPPFSKGFQRWMLDLIETVGRDGKE